MYPDFDGKSIMVYDIETDALSIETAKLKWFGAYSYLHSQYYLMPYKGNEKDVIKLLKEHKVLIGFNNKEFDNPIIVNNLNEDDVFEYKVILDLLEISAPKGGREYGKFRKNRLAQMGIKLKNFSLKSIIEALKLNKIVGTKGDIDYKIFQKDDWSADEIAEIKTYLQQDIDLTMALFHWYHEQFKPLMKFLPQKDQDNFLYLKSSLSVLAYNIICNKAGLKPEFGDKPEVKTKSYAGGHHLEPRWDLVRGNIIEVDFACLPEGEFVFTKNGYKKVEDLIVGDESISMDYKSNQIKAIRKEKSDIIIELTLSSGDILRVTPNHKIPIFKGIKKNTPTIINNIKITEAEKINIGDNLISPVLETDMKVGQENDLLELLGIFLCEGRQDKIKRFIADKKHPSGRNSTASRTELTIKKHELDFKRRIDELLIKHIPYKITWKEIFKSSLGRRYSSLSIKDTRRDVYDCFKKIVDDNYNLETITKNQSNIKSFLKGVFKSDATFNIAHNKKEFVIQNHDEKLMMIIRRCLDILGIYYNTYVSRKPEGHSKRKTISINISYGSELDKLFSWFIFESYRDEKICNKYSIYNQKNKIVKIIKIEKIRGDFNVYNISMDRQESPFYIHNGYYTKNSAYPHAIMMGNLHSLIKDENEPGWTGDGYYQIEGKYNTKQQGKVELALKDIFLERIKAKKAGDKAKNLSYKIIINSHYGTSGNPVFKSIYNRTTASDCTSMVRTWLKKLAQTLEKYGFTCLYGFTDSIFVLVPPHLTKQHLMYVIENRFMKEAKKHVPWATDTFKMEVEEEIKMIWFVAKNCYLFVTNKNEVKYKSTLLNTNTPPAVMKLFEQYMKPIIIEKLDIPFTKKELQDQLRLILEKEPELAAQEYKVSELSEYKVKSSLHYQISLKYGTGRHFLIPNTKNIGVGLSKSTKKKVGIRHCSIEDFKNNNLTINNIDLTHLLSHLKPFYERNEKDEKDDSRQTELWS